MAMHTRNLEADPRASLPGDPAGPDGGSAGRGARHPDGRGAPARRAGSPGARAGYLERHPDAAAWVDFDDFAFWRLEVAEVYYVGGFAAMDWVGAEAYAGGAPRPARGGRREHHRAHEPGPRAMRLLVFARVLGGIPADAARDGGGGPAGLPAPHPQRSRAHRPAHRVSPPVTSLGAARTTLIAMLADCRAPGGG